MQFDFNVIVEAVPFLWTGLSNTLLLALLGIIFSTFLGMICAVLRISNNKVIRTSLTIYVEVFRNTPIVAQIFYLYFVFPSLGITISAFACGLIALVLHFNAYNIDVFRSGLEAVSEGIKEASIALGFTPIQQLKLVVIPIAVRICLPALVNNYVAILKNTAFVSVIGVAELTFVASSIVADDFTYVEMYSAISVLYITLVFIITAILRKAERRFAIQL
jgi:His/Glu/Gln/Arg/opine family amino acid ABC transporter permease subunit